MRENLGMGSITCVGAGHRLALAIILSIMAPPASALGQADSSTDQSLKTAKIDDPAAVFSREAVTRADVQLKRLQTEFGFVTWIFTAEAFDGTGIQEVVRKNSDRSRGLGLLLGIGRKDRRLEIVVTEPFQKAIPREKQMEIRDAILDRFRKQDFDGGLQAGISAVETALKDARAKGTIPKFALAVTEPDWSEHPKTSTESGLIVKNRVGLTLEGARRIIAGCEAKASEMKLRVNIAVVDDGGHLLSFSRMDGARPASGYTALTKATTAATFRQETGPLPKGTTNADPLLNLSLQNAAAASGGKVTTLLGGVPILVDEQVIGAVGIGGGSGEQDAVVAKAGVERLMDALKSGGQKKP
jgi:uncharacterized protein GlcG (DUF336 family)